MEHIYLAEIGWPEMLLLLAVILILFGANRIPQVMRGLGQGISEFKKGLKEGDKSDSDGEKKGEEKKAELPPK